MSSIAARRSAPAPEKRTALACRARTQFPSASTAWEAGVQRSGSLMISRALTMTALVFGCRGYSHMTNPPEKFAQRPRSPPHLFLRLLIGIVQDLPKRDTVVYIYILLARSADIGAHVAPR